MNSSDKQIPISKSALHQHWNQKMEGERLITTVVKVKDADYFENPVTDLNPEEVIYEKIVEKSTSPEEGHLIWGNIVLNPGKINDEYFMTRGHRHATDNTEEYLLCMSGSGLLMFVDQEGSCWCEELEEGSLHHIPEGVGRRLINTGETPMILSFCVPANAGKDHSIFAPANFPIRVFDDNGEPAITVEIDESRPQDDSSVEEIEAILKM